MRLASLTVLGLALSACGPAATVPAFHLADVNPASPRAGTQVGPAEVAGKVSGWYFGHAT